MAKTKEIFEVTNLYCAQFLFDVCKIKFEYVYTKGNTPYDLVFVYEYTKELEENIKFYYSALSVQT